MRADVALALDAGIEACNEDALYRKVILRIVPLFFLGFIMSYLDRVNIGFAKLQMAADFGLTNAS
ncbi:MFS transporter, partial [Escherichia coli]|nr:MFS transporter [Escherichia coli]